MINVTISGKDHVFPEGIKLEELMFKIKGYDPKITVAAIVNNQLEDLSMPLYDDSNIKFLSINDEIGNRIYRRSLFIVLAKAIYDLFPNSKLSIEHSLSNGIYCEIHKEKVLTKEELIKIKENMIDIINSNFQIKKHKLSKKKLIHIYNQQEMKDKINVLNDINKDEFDVYELDGYFDYFFYNMVPRTSVLDRFDLHMRSPGFVLLYPQRGKPYDVPLFIEQAKLAGVFYEYEKWGEVIGVSGVDDLNEVIKNKEYNDLILITEALHEKKIANIADRISEDIENNKIILIAGPSSSGKTTFAQRLAIQLRVNGLRPVAISTDDYFVNREDTPLDEDGNYDFESINAIDLDLFNMHLLSLINGELINIPTFNFYLGKREFKGKKLKIESDQPIIIEGIHSLNGLLTEIIPENIKYKIYISALTQINIDKHNRIPTTDTRLIRRIVRDHYFRNHTASNTIDMWPAVRRGEENNIFPYQEKADIIFNSALIYELAVLKKYVEPLLHAIKMEDDNYYQAQRLLKLLTCFLPMPEDDTPQVSILKEFIGGSTFF
ncbi:uridine kinase family protein [Natronospora cellulosivora (SeqCode)]